MAVVWVTRSEPGASVLAQLLDQHGYDTWLAPVIEVVPVRPVALRVDGQPAASSHAPLTPPPHTVVALSAHAAREFLAAGLTANASAAKFIAVGEQTAAVLRAAGLTVQVPATASSEGLLQMPELTGIGAGETVWLLAGRGGRELLPRQLRDEQHCRVVKLELYCRRRAEVGAVDPAAVAAVVVASEEGLESFAAQWQAAAGAASVPVVVPSPRVARRAAELGFTGVHTADDASAAAVLKVLQGLSL